MDLKNCTPVLFVKDAKRSRDFYEKILGLTVTADFGGLNIIFKEGFALWQILDDNIVPKTLGSSNICNTKATSRFELCFETEDLDNVYHKLKQNEIEFLHEINTEIWGQRTIRFYDYDRHLIEVGEAMHVFLRRIYEEEGQDLEATAKRAYTPIEILKQILDKNKTIPECNSLEEVRSGIDITDDSIVALIAKRAEYVREASKFKKSEQAVQDKQRVEQVIASKKELAHKHNISPELIETIYRNMIDYFVTEEMKIWKQRNK